MRQQPIILLCSRVPDALKVTFYVFQIDVIGRDAHDDSVTPRDATSATLLRLRLSPHRHDNPDILADCPLDHPFFIKEKGKRASMVSYLIFY